MVHVARRGKPRSRNRRYRLPGSERPDRGTPDRRQGKRVQVPPPAGTSIRILFLFDPQRQAVLLVSGDKAGQWKQWYQQNIPVADQRYANWLNTETGGE